MASRDTPKMYKLLNLFAFASCFGTAIAIEYEPDQVPDQGVPTTVQISPTTEWRWFREDINCRQGGSGQADFAKYNRVSAQECIDFCAAQDVNIEYASLWDGNSQAGTCRCYYECGEGSELIFVNNGVATEKRNNVYKKWQCEDWCAGHSSPWHTSELDQGTLLSLGAVPHSEGKCDWIKYCDGCSECHSGCRWNEFAMSIQNTKKWGNAYYRNWCAHNCANGLSCHDDCADYCMDCTCGRRLNATVQPSVLV